MKLNKLLATTATALINADLVMSAPASFCPGGNDICFQWGVPESSASNPDSGSVYFQLKAPTSYQWVGLGIGQQMAGAHIFLMYQDGKGNVTISPRQGKGHVMPTYSENKDVELLDGSGVKDGQMMANVRCGGGCQGLDFSGSNDWIMAMKEGTSLDSTDPSETITRHDSHNQFQVDFAKASITSDRNPFVDHDDGSQPPPPPGNDDGAITEPNNPNNNKMLIFAHGVIMTVVFVAMYPIGSMLMPLLGKWYLHASWQFLGFLLMWAGFGVGYIESKRLHIFFEQTHTQLGIFVVSLMALQPVFGYLHHSQFRKTKTRGVLSHIHVWYGRALMILGIINGGLGLKLAGGKQSFIIGYSVAAGLAALLYTASSVFGVVKNRKSSSPSDYGEIRRAESSENSHHGLRRDEA